MSKDKRTRIFSFIVAALVFCCGVLNCLTTISFAANSTTWEDLGQDAIDLRDAYLRYLNGWLSGDANDIIGGAFDVPVSWFKTLSDGQKVISPVDDWYYYLTEGDEHGGGGGRVHSGVRGGGNEIIQVETDAPPVIPAEQLKKAASYWADYYKPMPTTTQYTWSYQTTESYSTSYPYNLSKGAPIYMHTNGSWGKKNWSGVYLLPFLTDDDLEFKSYYSKYYYHFYSTREDGSSTVKLHLDRYLLDTSELFDSRSWDWDVSNQLYLGFDIDNKYYNNFYFYYTKLYSDYLGNSSNKKYTVANAIDLDYFTASDYSTTSKIFPLRGSSTFTPNLNKNDDWGFILSAEPFELFASQSSVDFEKIPDNYYITVEGDNIYEYTITDPDSGNRSTINNYITNNYYIEGTDSSGGNTTNNIWNIDFPDFITNITTSIETAITNVFVANETVINNYNQEMHDTFNQKLPFLNDFGEIFNSLFVDIVDNNFVYAGDINKPPANLYGVESGEEVKKENLIYPKWEVNITFFGEDYTLTILDFSMYAEPLYYVRLVVCIFIYALYFVNLMKYLPTLIGNVVDMGGHVSTFVDPPAKPGKGGK